MDKHIYRTSVRWEGERRGTLSSPSLPELEVATPPEFPGGHEGLWSPEHLYTAAAEICLMTTFLSIAANSKLEFKEYTSQAEGTLDKSEGGFQMTEILLRPRVVVGAEALVAQTRRILEKAEHHCLISNSMKTKVRMEAEIVVG